jgi:predicted flap endonuclease-1-like 5' DNA nuclease
MVALTLQTLLLMVAAYFAGTVLACLVRRSLFAPRYVPAARRVDPLPEVAARLAEPIKAPSAARETAPTPAAATLAGAPEDEPAAGVGPQDLGRIRGIDPATEAALNRLGINRYDQIASWMRKDVLGISQALGFKGRISQENWIEQAAVLAKGGDTYHSSRRADGVTATATPTPDEGDRSAAEQVGLPRPMSRAGVAAAVIAPSAEPPATGVVISLSAAPSVAERAAFASAGTPAGAALDEDVVDAAAAVPMRPAPPGRDNLQRIAGITPELERGLNAQGVSRYAQIAHWSAADMDRFEKQLLTGGRIARENWVEQAQILSRGGDTRFSREYDAANPGQAGVTAARPDLGSLRSVRSEAYRDAPEPGPEAAQRAAAQDKVARAAGHNDLKRIRGIGVLIEKRLNAMGVTTYDHIANWTADDIERVSRSLDFKGRIERENWIEQARILSAGGQTEFSRRVDRGEVETSRAKT